MPIDFTAKTAIQTELDAAGLPGTVESVAGAIEAAGYEIQPSGGGTPVELIDGLAATRKRVTGCPGLFVVEITLSDGSVTSVLEFRGRGGQVTYGTVAPGAAGTAGSAP